MPITTPPNEIKIRGLSDSCLARIDDLARQHHQSRNEYLRVILESFTVLNEVKDREEREKRLLSQLTGVLEENTKTLQEVRDLLQTTPPAQDIPFSSHNSNPSASPEDPYHPLF